MKIDFIPFPGELAKGAYCIPLPGAHHRGPVQFLSKNSPRQFLQSIWTRLPPNLRQGKAPQLLGVAAIILIVAIYNLVSIRMSQAKWQREAPQREAAREDQLEYDAKLHGIQLGKNFSRDGRATGLIYAHTESDVRQLAEDAFAKYESGGQYDSPRPHAAFVDGFTESYIQEVNDSNRRNRPIN